MKDIVLNISADKGFRLLFNTEEGNYIIPLTPDDRDALYTVLMELIDKKLGQLN